MARRKQTATKKVPLNITNTRVAIKTISEVGSYTYKGKIIIATKSKENNILLQRRKNNHGLARLNIPKRPFQKIIRDISQFFLTGCRFQSEALYALQEAAEAFLVGYYEDGFLCQMHAGRKTLMKKDLELVRKMRKIDHWVPQ